jgi:hypothetical protein
VIFEATSWRELPNPQKALTKLTKGVVRGTSVSFVSGFPHPQISKRDMLPPSRPAEVSFTRQFFDYCQPRGPARDIDMEAAGSSRHDALKKPPYYVQRHDWNGIQ